MGRNLAWISMLLFAASWFLPVHQGQELASAMGGMASGMGKAMSGMAESMAESMAEGMAQGMGGTVTKKPPASGDALPDFSDMPGSYSGPPGWKAFRFAFDLLTDAHKNEGAEKDTLKTKLLGATSLTNVVMLLALLMLLLNPRGISPTVGVLLLACAALNLGWLYHNEGDFIDGLRLGYWLWTGSFLLAGIAGLRSRMSTAGR